MKVSGIEWDRANRRHFHERGRCGFDEVEDVLTQRCYPTRAREQATSAGFKERRVRFQGRACNGRFLTVIGAVSERGLVRPITGWPLDGKQLNNYLAWRKTIGR